MRWKTLETIINDHNKIWLPEELEKTEAALLREVTHDLPPLHAAKIAYVLILLNLRSSNLNKEKIEHYINNLTDLFNHVIAESEENVDNPQHVVYLRKLAEHYYHHLHIVAEEKGMQDLQSLIESLRLKNNDEILKLQKDENPFQHPVIQNTVVAGFFIAAAAFFAWSSFWNISDFAMANTMLTDPPEIKTSKIIESIILFIFSISILWIFFKKYGEEKNDKNKS